MPGPLVSRIAPSATRVPGLVLGDLTLDPTTAPWLTVSSGVPTADAPDGSLALSLDSGGALYQVVSGTWTLVGSAPGAVTTAGTLTDERLVRGAGGTTVQDGVGWSLSDAGLLSGALCTVTGTLTVTGATITGLGVASVTGAAVSSTLASPSPGAGASLIGVEDVGGYYTGATVEAVLQEIGLERQVTAALGGAATTTDNTTGATTGLGFAVVSGRTYEMTFHLRVATAALTNGWRCSIQESGGASSSGCYLRCTYPTNSSSETTAVMTAGTWTAAGTGPTNTGGAAGDLTNCTVWVSYTCTGTGTATLWFRPETSGNTATVGAGSFAVMEQSG